MRILFLFVDGLGLGARDPEINPCSLEDIEVLACFENGMDSCPAAKIFSCQMPRILL